jgi:CHASE2 domain-containing sensor protein
LYAQFLERLTAEKARAVTFDIIFSDSNTQYPQGDARFARAIKAEGHVILGRDYGPGAQGGMTCGPVLDAFSDAAADWGIVQVDPDQDFIVRKHFRCSKP